MAVKKLSAARLRNLKPGMFGDGGDLWLRVRSSRKGYWSFRYRHQGKSREISLGPLADVSAEAAREQARQFRNMLREGRDPAAVRAAQRGTARVNFEDAARRLFESKRAEWRNAKHAAQWITTLEQHAFPILGNMDVRDIQSETVLAVLEPLWTTKPETASRVRGRIENVLDYATARHYRSGANPARWKGNLKELLPRTSRVKRVKHFAALPYQELPGFMQQLATQPGISALALRFAILTAARTGEIVGALKSEISESVWIIPAARMKAGREHRVPLSKQARALLDQLPDVAGTDYVFESVRHGRPLSTGSLTAVLKRMHRRDLTVHGFRSTFRDWCAEQTNLAHDVVESALAHSLHDQTEAAYRRSDLLEKRAKLMQLWADFATTPHQTASVLSLHKANNERT